MKYPTYKNVYSTLNILLSKKYITRYELSDMLSLSHASIGKITDFLLETGVATQSNKNDESFRGPKTKRISLSALPRVLIIDLSGGIWKAVVTAPNLSSQILSEHRFSANHTYAENIDMFFSDLFYIMPAKLLRLIFGVALIFWALPDNSASDAQNGKKILTFDHPKDISTKFESFFGRKIDLILNYSEAYEQLASNGFRIFNGRTRVSNSSVKILNLSLNFNSRIAFILCGPSEIILPQNNNINLALEKAAAVTAKYAEEMNPDIIAIDSDAIPSMGDKKTEKLLAKAISQKFTDNAPAIMIFTGADKIIYSSVADVVQRHYLEAKLKYYCQCEKEALLKVKSPTIKDSADTKNPCKCKSDTDPANNI